MPDKEKEMGTSDGIKIDRSRLKICWMDPASLTANPRNHRRHPDGQRGVLRRALGDKGWIDPVIWNKRTGHIVDGHARVEEALGESIKSVPVIVLDVDEKTELKIMARHDRIGALATLDLDMLRETLAELAGDGISLEELGWKNLSFAETEGEDESAKLKPSWHIIIECEEESDQARLLEKLKREGIKCRALIS
jgi:hypothetical protein